MKNLIKLILATNIFAFASSISAAEFIYETTSATIGCPSSMKTFRYVKTNKVVKGHGCSYLPAGIQLLYIGDTFIEPDAKKLINLTNNRQGKDYFEGFVPARDLKAVEPKK